MKTGNSNIKIQDAPTKQEIADRLKELSNTMIDISLDMDYYGGFNQQWKKHAGQLYGAGHIVQEWVGEIRQEANKEKSID